MNFTIEMPILYFSQPEEERLFNERHSKFIELLPLLNEALDKVFGHSVAADRSGLTVFMLGRRIANDLSEILLLASNSYGFASLQVLRSMFEKLADALYLHQHRTEVGNFWDYHLVLLIKIGYEDIAAKFDPEWNKRVATFKRSGKKGPRTQPRWNRLTLVDQAKQVGLGDHLQGAYYLPNAFIHNSAAEILFALEATENGRLTPQDFNNPSERRMGDVALQQALFFITATLELEIDHYGWKDSEPAFKEYFSAYKEYLMGINATDET